MATLNKSKNKITHRLEREIDITGNIVTVISRLVSLQNEFAGWVVDIEWARTDYEAFHIEARCSRLESDVEYNKRMDAIKAADAQAFELLTRQQAANKIKKEAKRQARIAQLKAELDKLESDQ